LDHKTNASFKALNRILKAGGKVAMAGREMTLGGTTYEPGAWIITGMDVDRMRALAVELGLQIQAVERAPDTAMPVHAPRIGLYRSWMANIDEGWTDWVLDQHEFPHTQLRNDAVRAGHLEEQFDSILIAEISAGAILEGHAVGTLPGEFAGGIGEEGMSNLRSFVRAGGTLVTLGNASLFAIDKFSLPVKNVLGGLKPQEFFCSGSILQAEVREGSHPIVFGLPPNPALFFSRNPAFETLKDFSGAVLLGYPKEDNPLMSGYLLHPEKIQSRAAALDVFYGKGHIILIGFRPQWRGQSWGTFKVLFNSLMYGGGWKPEKEEPGLKDRS
jgi:hypothetical protein